MTLKEFISDKCYWSDYRDRIPEKYWNCQIREDIKPINDIDWYAVAETVIETPDNKIFNVVLRENSYRRYPVYSFKMRRIYIDNPRKKRVVGKAKRYHTRDMIQNSTGIWLKNSCQVYTVAYLLGLDYTKAANILREKGWSEENVQNPWLLNYADWFPSFGKKISIAYKANFIKNDTTRGISLKSMSLLKFTREYPTGCYMVTVRGHILCINDGIIIDNANTSALSRVDTAWLVTSGD